MMRNEWKFMLVHFIRFLFQTNFHFSITSSKGIFSGKKTRENSKINENVFQIGAEITEKMYTNYNSLNEKCMKYLFTKLFRAICMMEICEKLRGMKRK